MTSKVHTIPLSASFESIVNLLIKHKISGAPVVDSRGEVVGLISERDLFYHLFPKQEEFYKDIEYYMDHNHLEKEAVRVRKLKAEKLMRKEVISIGPDEHVLKACALLLLHRIRRLPVIENGKLVGIVTTNNLYKNFLRSLV